LSKIKDIYKKIKSFWFTNISWEKNFYYTKKRAYILTKDYSHKKFMALLRKTPSITFSSFGILEDLLMHAWNRENLLSKNRTISHKINRVIFTQFRSITTKIKNTKSKPHICFKGKSEERKKQHRIKWPRESIYSKNLVSLPLPTHAKSEFMLQPLLHCLSSHLKKTK
jgi:hypothetical protein